MCTCRWTKESEPEPPDMGGDRPFPSRTRPHEPTDEHTDNDRGQPGRPSGGRSASLREPTRPSWQDPPTVPGPRRVPRRRPGRVSGMPPAGTQTGQPSGPQASPSAAPRVAGTPTIVSGCRSLQARSRTCEELLGGLGAGHAVPPVDDEERHPADPERPGLGLVGADGVGVGVAGERPGVTSAWSRPPRPRGRPARRGRRPAGPR